MKKSKSKKKVTRSIVDASAETIDAITSVYGFAILKPLLSIHDTVTVVKARRFIEKLKLFLSETEGISEHDKVKFHQALGEDLNEFYENLIIVLEEMREKEKARIVGKLFKHVIYGHLPKDKFEKLYSIVQGLYYKDIEFFKTNFFDQDAMTKYFLDNAYNEDNEDEHILLSLSASGLIFKPERNTGNIVPEGYSITYFGSLLLDYGLK